VRVLVTGAAGQVGRALLRAAPAGAVVVGLTRADLDVGDATAVAAAVDAHAPDVVLNAAAYTAVDRAEAEADEARRANRDAPAHLARACAACGVRFVHLSTDFVFDGRASVPYPPDAPPSPLGVYGASKAAGEAAVAEACPKALVLRTAWVHAAEGSNFVRTMLRLMEGPSPVRVVADQVGTPTHAVSLARAIWRLTETGATGVHHYTDAGVASWYDFAVAIREEALALGLLDRAAPVVPIRTAEFPTPARRPAYSVLDKTATYAALGGPAAHWRVELRAALAEAKARRSAGG